ncbi:hypothetical protein PVK06_031810 [Gossypium arboreum]|uniref:Uncharacterized protein n=1 Tax=Gossypium arboreum TaxID=29729 RepID=A0ABR0NT52_GOSAR|nr:hypothetical protein PVK06_031810 [Gossypium arboreum]
MEDTGKMALDFFCKTFSQKSSSNLTNSSVLHFLLLLHAERERLPTVIRLTGVKLSPILYISSNGGTGSEALYANTSISTRMKGATKAMVAMNKIEMMSEAIDETLDKDEAEEEMEELTNQVLDEIGVDIASQLSLAPKGRIASKNAALLVNVKSEPTTDVDDLKKRLASLRRL